jgi:1-aminocyclopropane-1-carboxylate deaminase/D-cysteine desulfhydrase-like pyridoxal-dependent ACC family enzyme
MSNPTGINQYTRGSGKVSSLQKARVKFRKNVGVLEKHYNATYTEMKRNDIKRLAAGGNKARVLAVTYKLAKSVKGR